MVLFYSRLVNGSRAGAVSSHLHNWEVSLERSCHNQRLAARNALRDHHVCPSPELFARNRKGHIPTVSEAQNKCSGNSNPAAAELLLQGQTLEKRREMVSIIGCTGLGVFCVVLAVVLDNKVDQSISKLFFCLGIFALTTATLFVVTDDAGNDWMSGVIVVLLILALSAKPNQRMGKHL